MSTNILLTAIGFITGTIAARSLGPEGRGELAAIQFWPVLLASIACLGTHEAVVYFVSSRPLLAGRYLVSTLLLEFTAAIPISIIGWYFLPTLLASQRPGIVQAARWYLLFIPILILVATPHQVLRGMGKWSLWNIFRVLPQLAWFLVLVGGNLGVINGPAQLSNTYLLVQFLLGVITFDLAIRHTSGPYKYDRSLLKPILYYGLPQMGSIIPRTLNLRLDQGIIASWLSPELLGYYIIAVAWSSVYLAPFQAFGTVLFPRISSSHSIQEKSVLFTQTLRTLVLIICIGISPVLVLTPYIIPLIFGSDYAAAIPAALLLCLASAISLLNSTIQDGLRGFGYTTSIFTSEILGLAITIASLWYLLPRFGILGAAVSSVFSYLVIHIYLLVFIQSKLHLTISTLYFTRSGYLEIVQKFLVLFRYRNARTVNNNK